MVECVVVFNYKLLYLKKSSGGPPEHFMLEILPKPDIAIVYRLGKIANKSESEFRIFNLVSTEEGSI